MEEEDASFPRVHDRKTTQTGSKGYGAWHQTRWLLLQILVLVHCFDGNYSQKEYSIHRTSHRQSQRHWQRLQRGRENSWKMEMAVAAEQSDLDENIHLKNVADKMETFLGNETVVVVVLAAPPLLPQQLSSHCRRRPAASHRTRVRTRRQSWQSVAWRLVGRPGCRRDVACRDDVARRLCGRRNEFGVRPKYCGPAEPRPVAGPKVRRDRRRVPLSKPAAAAAVVQRV
jgi:hypothetical protein